MKEERRGGGEERQRCPTGALGRRKRPRRVRTVPLGNVVDELHDEHRLADTSTAEQADLTALLVRSEQVHHLGCVMGVSAGCGRKMDAPGVARGGRAGTLIPVVSISISTDCWSNEGASRWMGRKLLASARTPVG